MPNSNKLYLKLILVIITTFALVFGGFSLFAKNANLSPSDVDWSYCDDNFYAGKLIFCKFQLNPNKEYKGESKGYTIQFENSTQKSICWLEKKAIICNDIPTNDLKNGKNNLILDLGYKQKYTKEINVAYNLQKGANITHWFRYGDKSPKNYMEYMSSDDLKEFKEMGFDHVRLPIDVVDFYTNSDMYNYLGLAVKKITDQGLIVIVDGHSQSLDDELETKASSRAKYKSFWVELSDRLKGFDPSTVYIEPYNEPNFKDKTQLWSDFQLELHAAIRKVLPKNTIVLTANNKSYFNNFDKIELPKDSNIIIDTHYYTEFAYTHQGADFSSDFLENIKGLKYPYDAANCNSLLKSQTDPETRTKLQEYCDLKPNYEQQKANIQKNIKPLQDKNLKFFFGEFGSFSCQKNTLSPAQKIIKDSKIQYLKDLTQIFKELDIPNTLWGFDDCFGLDANKVDGKFEVNKDYYDATKIK